MYNPITETDITNYIKELANLVTKSQGASANLKGRCQAQYEQILDEIIERTNEPTARDIATAANIQAVANLLEHRGA